MLPSLRLRKLPALFTLSALLPFSLPGADGSSKPPAPVTAHEWGTFTTVAGMDGAPMPWRPLASADLPCFVERLWTGQPKSLFSTTVRMETPVIYFYSQQPTVLSVRVDFPKGLITEWYPKADAVLPPGMPSRPANGQIAWGSVEVAPGRDTKFATTNQPSHYFPARQTDATPLRSNGQAEKMLFYRGVGTFDVPVRASFDKASGQLVLRNTGTSPIPVAIYFENRGGGHAGFRVIRNLTDPVEWQAPAAASDGIAGVRNLLQQELVRAGLFEKEAEAMVETWRDSWFETGSRVFYVVPREVVDAVLPLHITPHPAHLERVFAGRVELLPPWRSAAMQEAVRAEELSAVAGRFLDPFSELMRRNGGKELHDSAYRAASQAMWEQASAGGGCVR